MRYGGFISYFTAFNDLKAARDKGKEFLIQNRILPRILSLANLFDFFKNIPVISKLIIEEKEILLFLFLQWLVICVSYFIWIQALDWIPDQIWDEVRQASHQNRSTDFNLINILLFIWSVLIIVVASFPIGVCNAAIVIVHNLRNIGESSTIVRATAIAIEHIGRVWIFTAIDAWITVKAIFERLPQKRRHRPPFDEVLYYAWKLSTFAVIPSLINGRTFIEAGKESLTLLIKHPQRAIGLRLGYSLVCWIVAVASYAIGIWYFIKFGNNHYGPHYIYKFYFLMAVPLLICIAIIAIIIRPFFLLGAAKFYTDYIDIKQQTEHDLYQTMLPEQDYYFINIKTIIFLCLLALVLQIAIFAKSLGISAWLYHHYYR